MGAPPPASRPFTGEDSFVPGRLVFSVMGKRPQGRSLGSDLLASPVLAEDWSLNGVKLGNRFDEVRGRLGEPSRSTRETGTKSWEEPLTTIWLDAEGRVTKLEGTGPLRFKLSNGVRGWR